MRKKRWILYGVLIVMLGSVLLLGSLIATKKISIAAYLAEKYEIQGVDVSHYQGNIDFDKIEQQGITFAYIKATEGSSHVDECFYKNWQAAEKTDMLIGAYHFFSFDSGGDTQAKLYIDTVGDLSGKLVPVVDVEYYGGNEKNPPDQEVVKEQLAIMLSALEDYYGKKPVIYTTYTAYYEYIKNEFDEYPLWIRNVYFSPFIELGRDYTFWQYTDKAILEGYEGDEKYIDRNVFKGTKEELEELVVR